MHNSTHNVAHRDTWLRINELTQEEGEPNEPTQGKVEETPPPTVEPDPASYEVIPANQLRAQFDIIDLPPRNKVDT